MKPNIYLIFGLFIITVVFMSGCAPQELAPETGEVKVPAVSDAPVEPAIEIGEAVESPTETIIPNELITEEEEPRSLFPGGTILYQQDGVTLEHYFPNTGSLKSDESEILVYNRGNVTVQITSSDMKFIVEGRTYEQYSGTWEKFPSQQSWEKIDYVNIKPPYYQGQPLVLEPGQKGKLHWHYQFESDIRGKEQAVDIEITFTSGGKSITIEKIVTREGGGDSFNEEPAGGHS